MTTSEDAIPKVAIGNPSTAFMAFDFIPDYVPRRRPDIVIRDDSPFFGDRSLTLSVEQYRMLSLCDGVRSAYTACVLWGNETYTEFECIVRGFEVLKTLRSHGVVQRDNSLSSHGLFIRIRDYRTSGASLERVIYLPAIANRVLALCSGSFSCREIAGIVASEVGNDSPIAARDVVAIVQCLVTEGVVIWLDTEQMRDRRFSALLSA